MADSAAIAGATAIDIPHLNETGEVILDPTLAETRATEYLLNQDDWSAEIAASIVGAPDGATITVVLEKDVDFTLLGPLLPGGPPASRWASSGMRHAPRGPSARRSRRRESY
mgnify:FL=1